MYVATANSKIYHLSEPPHERTVCGVKFMPIVMEEPRAVRVSLVRRKPDGYTLCRHCSRFNGAAESRKELVR